jgi:hypothetical protein
MRAYHRITHLEFDFTAYRDQLYGEFIQKYPGTNVTTQRMSDKCRAIVRNHQLLPALLEQIGSVLANGFNTDSGRDSDDNQNAKFGGVK